MTLAIALEHVVNEESRLEAESLQHLRQELLTIVNDTIGVEAFKKGLDQFLQHDAVQSALQQEPNHLQTILLEGEGLSSMSLTLFDAAFARSFANVHSNFEKNVLALYQRVGKAQTVSESSLGSTGSAADQLRVRVLLLPRDVESRSPRAHRTQHPRPGHRLLRRHGGGVRIGTSFPLRGRGRRRDCDRLGATGLFMWRCAGPWRRRPRRAGYGRTATCRRCGPAPRGPT